MTGHVEIEDIEGMRLRNGIDDVELREQIRGLRVGDLVKLTFLTGASSGETVAVRITEILGSAFRGALAGAPASAGLAGLRVGTAVAFTAAHIHSLTGGTGR